MAETVKKYIYKAKKGPEEIVTGEFEAVSSNEVISKLEAMGLFPIRISEKQGNDKQVFSPLDAKSAAVVESFGRIKDKDIDAFTWQLACLIKTSVPILRALWLISQQVENKELKKLARDLESRIRDGQTLSEALKNYPAVFNNLYINMVKFGEKSGMLPDALYKIAEYRENEKEIKRKIQAAVAYPLFLIVFGVLTVFVMLTFFMPKFIGLFEQMGQALPLSTRILINISGFMAANKYWFLTALIFLFSVFARVKPGGKKKFIFDVVKIYLPFIRDFVRDTEVVRFTRTLSMLFKSGIPVYESMELATDILDNDLFKERLRRSQREIVNYGARLSAALAKAGVFPVFVINMIAVGDEGGKLDEALNEIAYVYEKDIEQKTKIIISLLEPLIILVVGIIVGFIVFAMLMPIFNINVSIK